MNTTGFIRGYMAKNMNAEEFIGVVTKALSREFEEEVTLEKLNNEFKITMKNYNVTMSKELIEKIQSPYSVDRYVLEEFRKQGFDFDINRSQYIQYCYGKYVSNKEQIKGGIILNTINNKEANFENENIIKEEDCPRPVGIKSITL